MAKLKLRTEKNASKRFTVTAHGRIHCFPRKLSGKGKILNSPLAKNLKRFNLMKSGIPLKLDKPDHPLRQRPPRKTFAQIQVQKAKEEWAALLAAKKLKEASKLAERQQKTSQPSVTVATPSSSTSSTRKHSSKSSTQAEATTTVAVT